MSAAEKQYENFQALARGTNVNDVTLLATDYLNHFNEALMLAELVADMPDLLDEFLIWQPRHYKDHFRESGIADKELAVQAYDWSPALYKDPFEAVVTKLNRQLIILQKNLSATGQGPVELLPTDIIQKKCGLIRALIDVAGGIINGNLDSSDQESVDLVFTEVSEDDAVQQVSPPARISLQKKPEKMPDFDIAGTGESKTTSTTMEPNIEGEAEMSQSDIDALFD